MPLSRYTISRRFCQGCAGWHGLLFHSRAGSAWHARPLRLQLGVEAKHEHQHFSAGMHRHNNPATVATIFTRTCTRSSARWLDSIHSTAWLEGLPVTGSCTRRACTRRERGSGAGDALAHQCCSGMDALVPGGRAEKGKALHARHTASQQGLSSFRGRLSTARAPQAKRCVPAWLQTARRSNSCYQPTF